MNEDLGYVFNVNKSKPFLANDIKGVFVIRTPFRPNPIGLSILEILKIKDNEIYVENLDILDETLALDIKPYIPQFDSKKTGKIGWLKDLIQLFKAKFLINYKLNYHIL